MRYQKKLVILSALSLSILIVMPVAYVLLHILGIWPFSGVWEHLSETVLPLYLSNSSLLLIGVAVIALLLGTPPAWLTARYSFPGRNVLHWALLLPLAMPAYIVAYSYGGLLEYAGPVQSSLRAMFGWEKADYWFPQIRSLEGAIMVFGVAFYPYVYMLARVAFAEQSMHLIEAARSLGTSTQKVILRVLIPMARPAIVAGLVLALMETLADYGTVQYFGVPVLTTGIFHAWFDLADKQTATQLAALLLIFVLVLLWLERRARKRAQFYQPDHHDQAQLIKLSGYHAFFATFGSALPLLLGFIIPLIQLLIWAPYSQEQFTSPRFLSMIMNSLGLASGCALIVLVLGFFLIYARRLLPSMWLRLAVRLSGVGYAVPGTVIAVGVMIPLTYIDAYLQSVFFSSSTNPLNFVLSGSLAALVFAFTVRYMPIALNTIEAGSNRISSEMDEAGRSLGRGMAGLLIDVHAPILKRSFMVVALLVFVEVLKELPATFLLRPFGYNTLAVRAFELANDERLEDASIAALTLIACCTIPVLALSGHLLKNRFHPVKKKFSIAST